MKYCAVILGMICWSFLQAQTPVGKWETIDDLSGKTRSVVEITEGSDGKLYGKIVALFREPNEEANPLCDKCSGNKKNEPVIGMTIMNGLSKDDDVWNDGTILDPESGKVYDCKIWLEDGKLMVRGYLLFLYRTQEWHPSD